MFDIAITQSHLWIAFLIAFSIFAIFSIIFLYHWSTFIKQSAVSVLVETVYFVGAGIIFVTMGISAGFF